ncbi:MULTISPECIES: hypothetical protein [Halorussus]|uniref:hypothetical protein n=1 Tax=Halorussus TaxID=1070314 RepID=UPI0020A1ED6F|nr:hypothetical protein [Halorussus vallis]USZ75539.1 hypothetical protein NGM07_19170 [Halorussus vallis]
MNAFGVDGRWLLAESLRIGSIVLVGFLLAHFLSEFIAAFGIELLYGVRSTLIAVLRYTALLTALLYAITKGVDASPAPAVHGDD